MAADFCGLWYCATTGDMTLAVVNAVGERILGIDLLAAGTLRAGDKGQRLAVAYNDLTVLAAIPALLADHTVCLTLPHPEAGLSPFPWQVNIQSGRLTVKDATGRKIAGGLSRSQAQLMRTEQLVRLIGEGLQLLNSRYRGAARCRAEPIGG